ncbi:MAG: hypothetical protein K8S25_05875 [Alphaproteobacteria bacterium]|nr:hypothetical protein [Alphaproteobacteria bacterium]
MSSASSTRELGRGSRRAVILFVYGGYAAVACVVASGKLDGSILPSIQAVVAGILAWVGVWILSRMSRHWRWGQAPDAMLDEREVATRYRAYYLAYVLYNSCVFLSLVALSFFIDLKYITSFGYPQVSALLWGVFLVGWTLPSTILAWIDRPIGDD